MTSLDNSDATNPVGDKYAQISGQPDLPSTQAEHSPISEGLSKNVDTQSGKRVDRPSKFDPGLQTQPVQPEPAQEHPKPQPAKRDRYIGVVLLAILLIAGVAALLIRSLPWPSEPTPAPIVVNPTVPPPTASTVPSLTPAVTPTPEQIGDVYLAAVAARTSEDWPQAVDLFQQVYDRDPNYLDIQEQLGIAAARWGQKLIEQGDTARALAQLRNAARLSGSNKEVADLVARLDLYETARGAIERKEWLSAIDALKKLRAIQPDFLDSANQLTSAYLRYSDSVKRQDRQAALQACKDAVALKTGDSAAQACVNELTPPPPLAFNARVFEKPTDNAVRCGTVFESAIWGVVRNQKGLGIKGAIVQVQSADRKNTYKSKPTNSQGGFNIPGLGCTTWTIRLTYVPKEGELQAGSVSVELNGGRYSGAGVEFRQQ